MIIGITKSFSSSGAGVVVGLGVVLLPPFPLSVGSGLSVGLGESVGLGVISLSFSFVFTCILNTVIFPTLSTTFTYIVYSFPISKLL